MAEAVLAKFASSTKHRPHELDSVPGIARKLLATQFPNWRSIYPLVGADLARLEFCAEPGFAPSDWNARIALPLEAWKQLVPASEESMALNKTLVHGKTSYYDFRDHLLASPIRVDVEQDGPLLYFITAGAKTKNLRSLVDEQYPQLSRHESEALLQHLQLYTPHAHLSRDQMVQDVGFMLANMPMDQLRDVYLVSAKSDLAPPDLAPEGIPPVPAPVAGPVVLAPDKPRATVSQKHLDRLSTNAVYLQYAKDAQLPAHFPVEKTARQMLVSLLVPTDKHRQYELAGESMGKRQTRLAAVVPESVSAEQWNSIMGSVEPVTSLDMVNHPQVVAFYAALKSAMPREDLESLTRTELLQHMMTVHMPDYPRLWPVGKEVHRALSRYLSDYPTMDMDLIKI